jgi:Xaa-Pro aminopeptidase
VLVVEGPKVEGAEKPLNAFETLTPVPIDRRLIERSLLDAGETAWLDAYHARVAQELSPLVDDATRTWLMAATRPLGQG